MKKIFPIALLLACTLRSFAQGSDSWTLYLTNPVAANSKIGLKLAYQRSRLAYMAGYTRYYGAYPGIQGNLEFRQYFPHRHRAEFFYYGKALYGNTRFDNTGAKWLSNRIIELYYADISYNGPEKTYAALGAGGGCRWEFGRLNLSCNMGYKFTHVFDLHGQEETGQYETFFISGPGSIIDLNVLLGIRLN